MNFMRIYNVNEKKLELNWDNLLDDIFCQVDTFVQDAVKLGAKVVCGGQRSSFGKTFYEPTLLQDVTPDMLCVREEVFGPVAGIQKYDI